jgi:2-dehydropantoate 2-reductase
LRPICLSIAAETEAVAAAWGIAIHYNPEKLKAENYSNHKSSILQDLELGRPMEIDEISGAVQEAGRRRNIPTPTLDQCLALLRMRARLVGLYPS